MAKTEKKSSLKKSEKTTVTKSKNYQKYANKQKPIQKKSNAIERARQEFLNKKAEKEKSWKKKNEERDAAIKRAEQRKVDKAKMSKELDKRTKKGQPFMDVRIKNMLGKITSNPQKYSI